MAEDYSQFLSLDEIVDIDDYVYDIVEIPEWPKNGKPGKLMVRNATSLERDKWERTVQGLDKSETRKGNNKSNSAVMKQTKEASRALLISMCTVHPLTKERIFRDTTAVLQLARKNSGPISRLFNRIIELSDVSEDDLKEMELEFEENPTELSAID